MTDDEQTVEGADGKPIAPQEERQWAMVAHLGGLLTCFIAPLIVWLVKKDDGEFVADQSREALNFQITVAIASIVGSGLTVCLGVGFFVLVVVSIADIVFSIVAALRSHDGHRYRYPFAIRLI